MRMFEGYGARLLFQRVIETWWAMSNRQSVALDRIRDA